MYWSKKLLYILVPILILAGIELLFVHPHPHFAWEGWVGYDAVFGFISSTILVIIAKPLMDGLIKRPEDYYEDIYVPKGYQANGKKETSAGEPVKPSKEDHHE